MPPQVSGPGPGKGPVVVHSQDGVNETKSGTLQKKPAENQQDATCAPHRATPKEKSQKNLEKSMEGSTWFTELAKVLGDIETKQAEKVKKGTKPEDLKANSQELSTTSQSLNTVVKTIGEGLTTAARK